MVNGLMALPYFVALLVLNGLVVRETKEYIKKQKKAKQLEIKSTEKLNCIK